VRNDGVDAARKVARGEHAIECLKRGSGEGLDSSAVTPARVVSDSV
jgi:hypothetical protein